MDGVVVSAVEGESDEEVTALVGGESNPKPLENGTISGLRVGATAMTINSNSIENATPW